MAQEEAECFYILPWRNKQMKTKQIKNKDKEVN